MISQIISKRVKNITKQSISKFISSSSKNTNTFTNNCHLRLLNFFSSSHHYLFSQSKDIEKEFPKPKGKIIAIGGSAIDYQFKAQGNRKFQLHKSCPGKSRKTLGGVARNIADCSSKLGVQTYLITALGNDQQSNLIKNFCKSKGIKLMNVRQETKEQTEQSSAKYYAILDENNNELLGISEMQVNRHLNFSNISKNLSTPQNINITNKDIIVIDSNIPQEELNSIVQHFAKNYGCIIFFEAKGQKSIRVINSYAYNYINILKMNILQKNQIQKAIENQQGKSININEWLINNIGKNHPHFKSQIKCIITNGSQKLTLLSKSQNNLPQIQQIKVPKVNQIEKTTGAGDTFSGTFISMLLRGNSSETAIQYALKASKLNIESPIGESTISDSISLSSLSLSSKIL